VADQVVQPRSTGSRPLERWVSLAVLCSALLIVTLDNTILNVVLPTLARRMSATSSQLQWVVEAYVLVFAGLLLVSGSVADRVGRKRTLLAGLVLFILGSAAAAFSGTINLLIAARAGMGLGAALIMPSTLSIVTTIFTDRRERQRAFGIWAATSGVGIALGPIIGGLLLSRFWWGSVFLINVPIVAVSLAGALILLPDSKNPQAQPPDLVGSALSIAGLSLVLWAIIEAPTRGWSSRLTLGAGLGGLLLIAGFLLWERRVAHPMLHLSFFADRRFSNGIGALAFVMFGVSGALFVLTQYLQFVLGLSALQAGVRVLPAAGVIVLVAPLTAPLVRRFGVRIVVVAGLLLIGAGLGQLSRSTPGMDYLDALPYLVLLGLGMALVLPAATSSVMESLPSAHTGVGSATNSTFLQTGGALGVAVVGSMLASGYQDRLTGDLAGFPLPPAAATGALRSLGGALVVAGQLGAGGGPELIRSARAAFVGGMDDGLRLDAIVVLVVAGLAAFLMTGRPGRAERAGSEPSANDEEGGYRS
jgi:EmrB/QacA subfamily drug resistance transporter